MIWTKTYMGLGSKKDKLSDCDEQDMEGCDGIHAELLSGPKEKRLQEDNLHTHVCTKRISVFIMIHLYISVMNQHRKCANVWPRGQDGPRMHTIFSNCGDGGLILFER